MQRHFRPRVPEPIRGVSSICFTARRAVVFASNYRITPYPGHMAGAIIATMDM
jgi:hypothetical protein